MQIDRRASIVPASYMRPALLVALALFACTGTDTSATTGSATGDPTRPPRIVEVDAGNFHTCVRTDAGTVECWGQCGWQCGVRPSGATERLPVGGVVDAEELAAGDSHACVRTTNGEVACWGSNYLGLLGRESPDQSPLPLVVPDVHDAVEIAIDESLACARRRDGTVVCWGAASRDYDTTAEAAKLRLPAAVPGIVGAQSLQLTGSSACARTDAGMACASWASGSPDFKSRPRPTPVDLARADVVDTTFGTCTCTLGSDAVVHCEGTGILSARLADGSSPPVQLHDCPEDGLTGVRAIEDDCALMQDGTVRCWTPALVNANVDPRKPVAIEGIADAQSLAVGSGHACALRSDGALLCWGGNAQGQVDGVPSERGVWPPRVVVAAP